MAFDIKNLTSLFKADTAKGKGGQIIGVDIGTSAIKVVQIRDEDGTPTLDTYGELQLGPYASCEIGRTTDLPPKVLIEALVDIIRESSMSGNNAVLSIPYASSFATTFTLDTTEEAEITKRVPVEARKYIPVPLREVTLDWFVLSRSEKAKRTKIFLVALHNDILTKLRGVLTGAGLETVSVELEPFSVVRSALSVKEPTAAVIDFGAGSTKLYIVHDGVVQETHNLSHGGTELTDSIAQTLSVQFTEAEERKRTVGLAGTGEDDQLSKIIHSALDRLMREADRIIDAYEQKTDRTIASAILLGGGAAMPGLASLVSDVLQRKAVLAESFGKVAYPAFLSDTLKESAPSFSVALGGALRRFEQ